MCQACATCSQRNGGAGGTQDRQVQERPIEPFERMVVDVLGPLRPTKHGNRYLMIFVDVASRWVIPVPTPVFDAEATARILITHVWCEYGTLPKTLLSDQGSNFVGEVMKHIYQMLNISKVEGQHTMHQPKVWSSDTMARLLRQCLSMCACITMIGTS